MSLTINDSITFTFLIYYLSNMIKKVQNGWGNCRRSLIGLQKKHMKKIKWEKFTRWWNSEWLWIIIMGIQNFSIEFKIENILWDQQFGRLDYPEIPIELCEHLKMAYTTWWKGNNHCRIQLEYSFSFDFRHHRLKPSKHCCIDHKTSHFFSG